MALRLRRHLLTVLPCMLPMLLPWGLVPAAVRAGELVPNATMARSDSAGIPAEAALCRERINSSDWQGAVQACSQAIKINPKFATAWIDRCRAQRELNQLNQAMSDCLQAIQLEPDHSDAYLRLADVKGALKPVDYSNVLEHYGKAIELDPKNATAYNNRGVTRQSLQDYKGALDDYNKAIELVPGEALYYFNRGEILFLQGRRELGCSSFRQGRALNTDFNLNTPDFDSTYIKVCS